MKSKAEAIKWFTLTWSKASEWSPNAFHSMHEKSRPGRESGLNNKSKCSLPPMTSGGSLWGNPFLYHSGLLLLGVAISIHHPNRLNWLNWPRWLFTHDAFWLLGWIALSSNSQPKSNVTITLLLPSPEITALSCWCSCIQYSGPWNTRFSAPRLFFVFSRSFLPSLSPFSISIKGHPSAKYGSTFSCYPNSTVSALWTREHWLLLLLLVEGRLQTTHSNTARICLHPDDVSDSLDIQHIKQVCEFPLRHSQ